MSKHRPEGVNTHNVLLGLFFYIIFVGQDGARAADVQVELWCSIKGAGTLYSAGSFPTSNVPKLSKD